MKTLQFLLAFILISLSAEAFEDLHIEPSVGLGLNSLNMSTDRGTSYTPTNTNYYFFSLGFNQLSFQAKFPQKDTQEVRNTRVDSKIQDYQFSLDVYKNWKAAAYFQDYKGYYVENSQMQYGKGNPDLNFNHIGMQTFYVFNEKHASFLIQDAFWNETEDSSSWIVTAGLDRFSVEGDLIPTVLKVNKTKVLQSLNVNTLSFRAAYSRNWIWTHWFYGLAGGLGMNINKAQADYASGYLGEAEEDSKTNMNSVFASSGGYKWNTSKLGFFARVCSWQINVDDTQLSSNTSSSGFYYSSTF